MFSIAVEGYLNTVKEGITCQFETMQSQTQIEMEDREVKVRTAHITYTIDVKILTLPLLLIHIYFLINRTVWLQKS